MAGAGAAAGAAGLPIWSIAATNVPSNMPLGASSIRRPAFFAVLMNDEATAAGSAPDAPAERSRLRRGVPRIVAVAVLVVLAAAPLFLAPFATTTLTRIVVFALFAVSLDLLVGITGLPSLGHAAYFGAGAYAAGWVSINVTAAAPEAPDCRVRGGRRPGRVDAAVDACPRERADLRDRVGFGGARFGTELGRSRQRRR